MYKQNARKLSIGMRIGEWEILEFGKPIFNKRGQKVDWFWTCKCHGCNKKYEVRNSNLRSRKSQRCLQCAVKDQTETGKQYKIKFFDPKKKLWNRVKSSAKKRNIVLETTKEEIFDLYNKQKGLCALTGLTIELPSSWEKEKFFNYFASLDRKNSEGPYRIDNLQWVHKDVNRMKNKFSQERFIEICRLVTENQARVVRQIS